MKERELAEAGFSEALVRALSCKSLERAERILNICRHRFIEVIPISDENYPENLKRIPDAPQVIYAKGDMMPLQKGFKVGFVGTRKTSHVGREFSTRLAEELVERGVIPISGGARGTDAYPIISAVEKGLYSAVVLGCDIDQFYPAEHYSLFECVSRCGVVISEYPPETGARFFPTRNRIIAALCDRLVVAEAPLESGALITADYASGYSKPIFAPDIEGENHAGCRELIARGAHTLSCADDVFNIDTPTRLSASREKIKKEPIKRQEKKINTTPEIKTFSSPVKTHVYSCILNGHTTVEEMVNDTFRVIDIICAISELELDGEITALSGGRYSIVL